MLAEAWDRAAMMLEMLCDAEEEICCPLPCAAGAPPAARVADAVADHGDIRAAVAEARLAETGCPAWWRAVSAVVPASREHFAREEHGVLADVRHCATPALREALGRQWDAFITAQARDHRSPLPG